jgi:hypothetical protein
VLNRWDQGVLAQAFGLGPRQVRVDASEIARWRGPADELLAVLRDRHDWAAVTAYRYLRTVLRALRGQQPR